MTKEIVARRQVISPDFFPQAEIDRDKVSALIDFLKQGGEVPPVVVAMYGDKAMPLDGHHRMSAFRALGRDVDAYVVDGEEFDDLCSEERNGEAFVLCDGVQAMAVAHIWPEERLKVSKVPRT